MIKLEKKVTVTEATCDGCRKSLIHPLVPHNANYGLLRSSFGYGSELDDIDGVRDRHLCEECWTKALMAVGLLP